jgi:hypothetical protein
MGFFWQGFPPHLIPWTRSLLGNDVRAVETGTFEGDTALLLAESFGSCVTIERSANLAQRARRRFAADDRISVIEGSSRNCLADAVPGAEQPALFWLDAHGFYDYAGEDEEENPLLAELSLIFRLRGTSPTVIAIDDARGMGIQPGWPDIGAITAVMSESGYTSAIIDDVLVATPARLDPDFLSLYRRSRIVDAGALFHVWPQVKRVVNRRARMDVLVERIKKLRGF